MWHKSLMTAGLAVAVLIGIVPDEQEEKDIRAIAAQLQLRARAYLENGDEKAAAEMQQKANAVLQELERRQRGSDDLIRQRRAEELRRALSEFERHAELLSNSDEEGARIRLEEIREQMLRTRSEMRRLIAEEPVEPSVPESKSMNAAKRLEHMKMAIEHLQQAEQHDLTEEVIGRAEALARAIQPPAEEPQVVEVLEDLRMQVEDLRNEVSRLRAEVEQLRRQND